VVRRVTLAGSADCPLVDSGGPARVGPGGQITASQGRSAIESVRHRGVGCMVRAPPPSAVMLPRSRLRGPEEEEEEEEFIQNCTRVRRNPSQGGSNTLSYNASLKTNQPTRPVFLPPDAYLTCPCRFHTCARRWQVPTKGGL
jgi:hypothetical protein